jgi:hypothetical protein
MEVEYKETLTLEEFFELSTLVNNSKTYFLDRQFGEVELWGTFRKFANKYLKLQQIVTSKWFDILITAVVLLNSAVVIINETSDDYNYWDVIDEVLSYAYYLEFLMKIVGLGVLGYFQDSWNQFDFGMLLISLFSTIFFDNLRVFKNIRSARATRLLRLAKVIFIQCCLKG